MKTTWVLLVANVLVYVVADKSSSSPVKVETLPTKVKRETSGDGNISAVDKSLGENGQSELTKKFKRSLDGCSDTMTPQSVLVTPYVHMALVGSTPSFARQQKTMVQQQRPSPQYLTSPGSNQQSGDQPTVEHPNSGQSNLAPPNRIQQTGPGTALSGMEQGSLRGPSPSQTPTRPATYPALSGTGQDGPSGHQGTSQTTHYFRQESSSQLLGGWPTSGKQNPQRQQTGGSHTTSGQQTVEQQPGVQPTNEQQYPDRKSSSSQEVGGWWPLGASKQTGGSLTSDWQHTTVQQQRQRPPYFTSLGSNQQNGDQPTVEHPNSGQSNLAPPNGIQQTGPETTLSGMEQGSLRGPSPSQTPTRPATYPALSGTGQGGPSGHQGQSQTTHSSRQESSSQRLGGWPTSGKQNPQRQQTGGSHTTSWQQTVEQQPGVQPTKERQYPDSESSSSQEVGGWRPGVASKQTGGSLTSDWQHTTVQQQRQRPPYFTSLGSNQQNGDQPTVEHPNSGQSNLAPPNGVQQTGPETALSGMEQGSLRGPSPSQTPTRPATYQALSGTGQGGPSGHQGPPQTTHYFRQQSSSQLLGGLPTSGVQSLQSQLTGGSHTTSGQKSKEQRPGVEPTKGQQLIGTQSEFKQQQQYSHQIQGSQQPTQRQQHLTSQGSSLLGQELLTIEQTNSTETQLTRVKSTGAQPIGGQQKSVVQSSNQQTGPLPTNPIGGKQGENGSPLLISPQPAGRQQAGGIESQSGSQQGQPNTANAAQSMGTFSGWLLKTPEGHNMWIIDAAQVLPKARSSAVDCPPQCRCP